MSFLYLLGLLLSVDASIVSIPYGKLQAESEALLKAFAEDGILLVPGVPGYAAARQSALEAMGHCFVSSKHQGLKDRILADGSQRRTAAAETNGHRLGTLDVGCPEFEQKADVLRTVVHMTLMEVLRLWGLAGNRENHVVLRHEAGTPYMSLSEAVSSARHLEHFHLYTSKEESLSDGHASLELHTDAGLLLAFASPFYDQSKGQSNGLLIQRATSTLEAVDLPGDALAFVVGEAARWLPWPSHPLPHELRLPSGKRAWYGVMTRLPEDTLGEVV